MWACDDHDCAKAGARACIEQLRRAGIDVETVGCQKICDGPVVGVGSPDEVVWFERMGSHKAMDAFVDAVTAEAAAHGSPGDVADHHQRLRRRIVAKRRGRFRT